MDIFRLSDAFLVSLLRNNAGYLDVVMLHARGNDVDNDEANSTKIDNTRYPAYNLGITSLPVVDD